MGWRNGELPNPLVGRDSPPVSQGVAWLLGFTSTLQTIALARIGTTSVSFALAVAVLWLFGHIVRTRGHVRVTSVRSIAALGAFFVYASFSVLLVFAHGMGDKVDVTVKSLIVLSGYCLIFIAALLAASTGEGPGLLKGLMTGAVVNALYGVYQYVGSYQGWPGLEIAVNYQFQAASVAQIHRAAGFTGEPSYLAALLIPVFLVWLGRERLSILDWFVGSSLAAGLLLTFSSGIIVLGFGLGIFFLGAIVGRARLDRARRRAIRLVFVVIALVIAGSLAYLQWVPLAGARLAVLVDGMRPQAAQNEERLVTISDSLKAGTEQIVGVGYGLGPAFLQKTGRGSFGTRIHSYFAALLLEVGVPGLALFLWFLYRSVVPCIRFPETRIAMLGIAGLTSFIYSTVTYNALFPFQWVCWGLAACYGCSVRHVDSCRRLV